MTLTVDIGHRFGTFALEASLTADGGVTALFGRSGSGKTSLVRIIAGLVQPDRGRVIFDGRILTDTQAGLSVPVHRRRFGYVFQEARLFPHLTVQGNLTYGRWFTPMSERQADFRRIIDMLGIGALLARMPSGLSGGEKQRVAIGRALLSSPRLLLMDEPLSALDEARRADILPYLERLRDETRIPIIYVSHSVGEVARLANRVVLLRDGAIQAMGSPSDIFSRQSVPEDRRQAGALLDGQVCAIDAAHRLATIALKGGAALTVPAGGFVLGRSVRLHVPARDVMIATLRPDGLSALNILDGKVLTIGHSSDGAAEIRIDCNGHILLSRITSFSAARLDLTPDKPVFAIVKTVAIEP